MDPKRIAAFLLLIAPLLIFATLVSQPAHGQEPGEVMVTPSYCLSEDAAQALSAAVASHGTKGYFRSMREPTLRCYDARIHGPVHPVRVTLVEKQWVLHNSDEGQFDIWTALDNRGLTAWIWIAQGFAEKSSGQPT